MKCHFYEEEGSLFWESCNLQYVCGGMGCDSPGRHNYIDAEGKEIHFLDLEPLVSVDNILEIADRLGTAEAVKLAVENGYKVSFEVDAACFACVKAGHVLPGHYRCIDTNYDNGREVVVGPRLTENGWKAVIK